MGNVVRFFFAIAGHIETALRSAPHTPAGLASFAALAALGGVVAGVSPDGLLGSLLVLGKLEPPSPPGAELSVAAVAATPAGALAVGSEAADGSASAALDPGGSAATGGGLRIGVFFSAGMVAGLTALGGLMGAAGHVVLRYDLARWLPVVTLLMGLRLVGVLRFGWLRLPPTPRAVAQGPAGAFALGLPIGIAASPCTLPILLGLLGLVASGGSVVFGLAGLAAFGLGRSIPVLAIAAGGGRLGSSQRLARWAPPLRRATGALLVLVSVYFLTIGRSLLG